MRAVCFLVLQLICFPSLASENIRPPEKEEQFSKQLQISGPRIRRIPDAMFLNFHENGSTKVEGEYKD